MESASRIKRREAIIPLLKDGSDDVRLAAARALEALEAAQSLEELLTRLKEGDRGAKIGAIYALGRLGGEKVLPILLYCAARPEEDIKCAAVKVLGELAHPQALALLVEKLRDPLVSVRAVAIEALSHYRVAALVPRLLPFLKEGDGLLDAEAALALGRIGDATLEEPLLQLFNSPHPRTRSAAVTALSQLP